MARQLVGTESPCQYLSLIQKRVRNTDVDIILAKTTPDNFKDSCMKSVHFQLHGPCCITITPFSKSQVTKISLESIAQALSIPEKVTAEISKHAPVSLFCQTQFKDIELQTGSERGLRVKPKYRTQMGS